MNLGAIQQRALTFWRGEGKKVNPFNGPMKHIILRNGDGRSCPTCGVDMVHYPNILVDHSMPEAVTIEHILPRSLGGMHDEENLTTICNGCNRARGMVYSDQVHTVNASGIHNYIAWLFRQIEDPFAAEREFPDEHRRFLKHWQFLHQRIYFVAKPIADSSQKIRRRAVNMSASARHRRPGGGV
jgi:hypothetical protein